MPASYVVICDVCGKQVFDGQSYVIYNTNLSIKGYKVGRRHKACDRLLKELWDNERGT